MSMFRFLRTKVQLRNYGIKMELETEQGPIYNVIKEKLTKNLAPIELNIYNESHKHAHHSAMRGVTSKETHFRIHVVSEEFRGKNLMQRHRMIYSLLEDEMKDGYPVHALSLSTKLPEDIKKETK